ncbi:hypothetical protein BDR04DRAFT_980812, partial [Suillus decipiens]
VLGIYHMEVWLQDHGGGQSVKHHLEVLWVQWLAVLQGWRSSMKYDHLPKIALVEESDPNAFSFLNLGQVIQGMYLIPAFASKCGVSSLHHGKFLAHPEGQLDDWEEYYVGIFVDWDMFMCYMHLGIG